MANFPPNYFQGEIRDDFYIEPMMKCAWAAEIEVLEVVAEICNRHNIQYFADYAHFSVPSATRDLFHGTMILILACSAAIMNVF